MKIQRAMARNYGIAWFIVIWLAWCGFNFTVFWLLGLW